MKPLYPLFPAFFMVFSCLGQTLTIKKVELAGEKIIVRYDLEDSNPNNEYLLNLYSSKDNFAAALTKVTGDVGMEIKPGVNKAIIWNVIQEFGGYKGKLALELKGKVYAPFAKLQGFDTRKIYRKGKSHTIKWKSGGSNPINIELYKGGERITGEINHPNNGSYTLFIPGHAKTGKDYHLKISDARNSEEVINTNDFRVGSKIPLWMKVAPVAVVGIVVAVLSGGGGGGGDNGNGGVTELPAAPGVPTP